MHACISQAGRLASLAPCCIRVLYLCMSKHPICSVYTRIACRIFIEHNCMQNIREIMGGGGGGGGGEALEVSLYFMWLLNIAGKVIGGSQLASAISVPNL